MDQKDKLLALTLFLVNWQAQPLFNDRRKLPKMADPRLEGRYPMRGLYQALAVASMCIQSEAASREKIAIIGL